MGRFEQVSDALVLAAIERAERHREREGEGVMMSDMAASRRRPQASRHGDARPPRRHALQALRPADGASPLLSDEREAAPVVPLHDRRHARVRQGADHLLQGGLAPPRPLARTSALYHELKESHSTYEGIHDYWRDRYKVSADELGVRPKVVSAEWHRLRANVACLIDWLRIAAKNGWLGSTRAARRAGERKFQARGQRIATRLAKMRVRMGLARPYGVRAAQLGLGQETPPSRRPRPAPPGSP